MSGQEIYEQAGQHDSAFPTPNAQTRYWIRRFQNNDDQAKAEHRRLISDGIQGSDKVRAKMREIQRNEEETVVEYTRFVAEGLKDIRKGRGSFEDIKAFVDMVTGSDARLLRYATPLTESLTKVTYLYRWANWRLAFLSHCVQQRMRVLMFKLVSRQKIATNTGNYQETLPTWLSHEMKIGLFEVSAVRLSSEMGRIYEESLKLALAKASKIYNEKIKLEEASAANQEATGSHALVPDLKDDFVIRGRFDGARSEETQATDSQDVQNQETEGEEDPETDTSKVSLGQRWFNLRSRFSLRSSSGHPRAIPSSSFPWGDGPVIERFSREVDVEPQRSSTTDSRDFAMNVDPCDLVDDAVDIYCLGF